MVDVTCLKYFWKELNLFNGGPESSQLLCFSSSLFLHCFSSFYDQQFNLIILRTTLEPKKLFVFSNCFFVTNNADMICKDMLDRDGKVFVILLLFYFAIHTKYAYKIVKKMRQGS